VVATWKNESEACSGYQINSLEIDGIHLFFFDQKSAYFYLNGYFFQICFSLVVQNFCSVKNNETRFHTSVVVIREEDGLLTFWLGRHEAMATIIKNWFYYMFHRRVINV
jgi:hypothetical protein